MTNLIELIGNCLAEEDGISNETQEYRMQSEKTEKLYDELYALINESEKEKLRALSNEYSILSGIDCCESFVKGFKTAFALILQTMI